MSIKSYLEIAITTLIVCDLILANNALHAFVFKGRHDIKEKLGIIVTFTDSEIKILEETGTYYFMTKY